MTHCKAEIRWTTSSSAARGTTSSMEIQADQIDRCIQKMNQASLEFYTPVGEMDISHMAYTPFDGHYKRMVK